jgi:spoIIIJ-associated protein
MEWVEVTGRTVEEAREQALDLLGVAEEDTEVEVLAEPRMGLFGRLRDEARVRARLLPAVPRSKDDSARRRRGGRRPAGAGDAAPEQPEGAEAVNGGRPEPADGAGDRAPAGPNDGGRPPAARSARAGRATVAGAVDEQRDDANVESTTTGDPRTDDRPEVPVTEQAEVAKRFVEGLLETMGIEGSSTVIVEIDEDTAEVQVTGNDLGLLIGPKGATLLALQDLARTVVQRKTGARTGRLLLDVAGYRAKRKEALSRFTEKVAQQVLDSGEPAALEPMSSADRKIVHDTANAIEGVTTSSEGEDPRRRVVVHPA